ncbi:hypothetical protein [uncultured Lamprocystis sp.]|jgi:hypothetical protein|uniref:hypothetical protein n=1 Tax=uncultured Lamprocystis sp. TaxID=543132 RepID=UPI0025F67B2C|nr:hypothetical protein [uncultured Lamprocystis sp.]
MDRRPSKPWHRWLGILLTDLFVGRPWSVTMEEELSLKSQRLDRYGLTHYRPRSRIGSFLHEQLTATFGLETDMAYTAEAFKREAMRDLLEDVLHDPKHLRTLLDRLVEEDRLRELTPEERLRGLAPEARLEGLYPAIIEAWLKQHPRHDH